MTKVIKAKSNHRLWFLSGDAAHAFNVIDVIGWEIAPDRPPIPITVAGRHEGPFALGHACGWTVFPENLFFRNSRALENYLEGHK
jgi:hypothetical protein